MYHLSQEIIPPFYKTWEKKKKSSYILFVCTEKLQVYFNDIVSTIHGTMKWIKTSHLLKNLINNERIKKNIN